MTLRVTALLTSFLVALRVLGAAARVHDHAPHRVQERFQAIDWQRYEDEAVLRLQQYLRIDTSNPPGNEAESAEFFHQLFDQQGIPSTVYPYAPGRANLYAVLK